ncbi:hypothetical protein HK405_013927, partial [Cladochytrium tenue]
NMKFIGAIDEQLLRLDLHGQAIIPALVGGRIFCQSTLNTLLVQTYYNPHLLVTLKHWLFPSATAAAAPASVTASDAPAAAAAASDSVFRVRVPRRFAGVRYAVLVVRALRDHDALCIGLHRRDSAPPPGPPPRGPQQQQQQQKRTPAVAYVVANPSPDTVLRPDDAVFVLAAAEPVL